MKWHLFFVLLLSGTSWAVTPPETHSFHVLGRATYRCYAGYSGKKAVDELTKQPCDNKTYESVVVDKVVSIEIKDEPDPDSSPQLEGSWLEKFAFKGRQFVIAISLFKEPALPQYRVRVVADDNQPGPRSTAVFTEMKTLTEMNPLSVEINSVGKKEEIYFSANIKPSLKK